MNQLPKSAASEPENVGLPKGFGPKDLGLPAAPRGVKPMMNKPARSIKTPTPPMQRVRSSMPQFRGTPSSMPQSTQALANKPGASTYGGNY